MHLAPRLRAILAFRIPMRGYELRAIAAHGLPGVVPNPHEGL